MNSLVERLLTVPAFWVYLSVGLLVFGEDAVFVGFVLPGQTAAMIGGVAVSRGHVALTVMAAVAVLPRSLVTASDMRSAGILVRG